MHLVKQRGRDDCAVAAYASVTNRTYEGALSSLGDIYLPGVGTEDDEVAARLQAEGYEVVVKKLENGALMPFAKAHLGVVYCITAAHMVVVDDEGVIFDPTSGDSYTLEEYTTISPFIKLIGLDHPSWVDGAPWR